MATALASILWITGFRRNVVRRNLELMRWKNDPHFRWRLTRNAARDLIRLISGDRHSIPFDARSRQHLETLRKNPGLFLTAHFHNWELMGSMLAEKKIPLLSAARSLQTLWAESWLQRLRRNIGVLTVNENVPRTGLRHLQQNGTFALLWDQHSPDSNHTGNFFDLTVQVNPLPIFALRHHPCPVYFGVLLENRFRLIPLLSGFNENWEQKLIRRYHRVLEVLIRMHPELWYGFFHARFKNIALYPGHPSSLKTIPRPA